MIRLGNRTDASIAISVLRRSICDLCVADNQGDARALSDWLRNKNAVAWVVWVGRKDAIFLVAEQACAIVGVGMVDHKGEILLNYVDPEFRFQGVSKNMLAALEGKVRANETRMCFLQSTETARKFCQRYGYTSVDGRRFALKKSP